MDLLDLWLRWPRAELRHMGKRDGIGSVALLERCTVLRGVCSQRPQNIEGVGNRWKTHRFKPHRFKSFLFKKHALLCMAW